MKQIESETPVATVSPEVAKAFGMEEMPNVKVQTPKAEPLAFPALGKEHDISAFASTDATRYMLQSVHLDPKRKFIEATNGMILIRVPFENSAEFPDLGAGLHCPEKDMTIPIEPYKKALGTATRNKSIVPALTKLAVASNGEENKVSLVANDLDTQQTFKTKTLEGNYPQTDFVIPEPGKHAFCLSGEQLGIICEYARKHALLGKGSEHPVTFTLQDECSPLTFSIVTNSGKATGVLMPMRMA